jgi:hypothetical protein
MKLVRSDSPEVLSSIASSGTLALRSRSFATLVCMASAPGLIITLIASLTFSMHVGVWFGVPVVFALNGFLLRRGRSPRLNWVISAYANRVLVRLLVPRRSGRADLEEPDVIMFEASDIASISMRTTEVFLYGPKPQTVESLVIELSPAAKGCDFSQIPPLRGPAVKPLLAANEGKRLTMNWRWCRPDLKTFLLQLVRGCPSVTITPEEHSELDLNGIWKGVQRKPDVQERRMLVQAKCLGLGGKCEKLLVIYKGMSFCAASAYLAEIEREATGAESPAGCSVCLF